MSASLGITDLPLDVLLELAKQLNISDLVILLSTCRLIRKLEFQRTLWLDALTRMREVEMQPALDSLSLSELQNTVRQANRLMNNFKSDQPRPVRIRTFEFECIPALAKIFCIPGTSLVVVHIVGSVSCWDILTAKRVACLEIPNLRIQTGACMEIKGKALIGPPSKPGMSTKVDVQNLVAIYIDYNDRAHISISHVVSPETTNITNFHLTGFFINSQALGFFINPNAEVRNDPHGFQMVYVVALRCLPLERRLYIFEMGSLVATQQSQPYFSLRLHLRLRRPSTLKNAHQPPDVTQLSIPYPFSRREILSLGSHLSTTYHTPHVFTLHYGIFAVTWREIHWTNHKSFIIHFWPGHTNDDGNLIIGPGAFYEHPNRICQMAVGLHLEDGEDYLGLLHFTATSTPHIMFRRLDVPDVALRACEHIAFDDSLGLVLVLDKFGRMTTISYV
ncbi:hypothetical protein B0H13DRAFT_2130475 [Mycena leptocephala]|nr:hypothetical protein B0H13DRAFT_2130475 [Mycena leptocephala]